MYIVVQEEIEFSSVDRDFYLSGVVIYDFIVERNFELEYEVELEFIKEQFFLKNIRVFNLSCE